MDNYPVKVTEPVDSNEYPVAVLLLTDDDIDDTWCDSCGEHAGDWRGDGYSKAGAMWHAAIYCADCMPLSYLSDTGDLVITATGKMVAS